MPKSCVAGLCSRQTKRDCVSLHVFPKEPSLRRQWVKFVQLKRKDFTMKNVSEHTQLCHLHFHEENFINQKQICNGFAKLRILSPEAIPTVHPPPRCPSQESIPEEETSSPSPSTQSHAKRQKLAQKRNINQVRIRQDTEQ